MPTGNIWETGGSSSGPRKIPEYYGASKSPERLVENGGAGSPESKASTTFESTDVPITFENLDTGEVGEAYNPNERYDTLDPTKKSSGKDDSAMQPYQIGTEYGYPVIFHPKTGWYVLKAPLPTVFFLDQEKLEVARRYPEYELVYSMGSEVLVRKTPFIIKN